MNEELPWDTLEALEAVRGSRVIAYIVNDESPKNLSIVDLPPLAGAAGTRSEGHARPLDLLLHTHGGVVTAVRGMALQLRSSAVRLGVLVPHRARSAGALLALAADELVLGSMAEFSPIDPVLRHGVSSSTGPREISCEDIRAFKAMAESWFDLRSEQGRIEVLRIVSDRFFPTTLSAFFRAEQYVRKVAHELLDRPERGVANGARSAIVDRLLASYPNHSDPISRQEILELGLPARVATPDEERLMNSILSTAQAYMRRANGVGGTEAATRAVLFSRGFAMKFAAVGATPDLHDGSGDGSSERQARGQWTPLDLPCRSGPHRDPANSFPAHAL